MMAASESRADETADDECDLLIGDSSKQGDKSQDKLDDHTARDGGDEDNSSTRRLSHRASPMNILWSRVRSLFSGVGNASRSDDLGPDWTLDSGIIYRSNTAGSINSKRAQFSLNSFEQHPSRILGLTGWFTGGGGKSHGFKREEPSHRRVNHDHYHYLKNGPNKCRMLLTFATSLVFLGAILLILVKLMNLLHEPLTRAKMSQMFAMNNDHAVMEMLDYDTHGKDLHSSNRWIVSSPKCRIPNIEPWHESIRDYVRLKPEYNCTQILLTNKPTGQPGAALTFVWSNKLYFTDQAIKSGAMKDCCYKQVTRSEDNDNDLVYSDYCNQIDENGLRAPSELIQVKCLKFNYTNVHAFVVHEQDDEEASILVAAKKLNTDQYYNVLMVGVDTISRLNGLRQLNRTLSLLRNQYKTLEFTGYNKVGENTFPNLVPLLTGLRPEQLTETQCWLASNYSQESESGDDFLDNCKYLWTFYQSLGYRTYFGEDWPAASTFNYLKQGFKNEPTSFYGRPFTIARDKILLPPVKMGCNSPCLWDRSIVELDLLNLKNFIQEHKHRPHFAFHWINCPQHDDLNGASRIDRLLEAFFNDIHPISQADRTFVIFFSDHGYRWNNFVSTRVGHYESSLPMLTIAPPKHFIENHPNLYENMKLHMKTLLTPFDMFKTLIDIRDLGLKTKSSKGNKVKLSEKSRRIGATNKHLKQLINETTTITPVSKVDELSFYTVGPTASTTIKQLYIPDGLTFKQNFRTLSILKRHNSSELDRSCIEAGIPDNYCVCHEFESVPESTKDVQGATYYLVYIHLHSTIKNHLRLCHRLDLEKIHKAEVFNFEKMKSTAKKSSRRKRSDNSIDDTTKLPSLPIQSTTSQPVNLDTVEATTDTSSDTESGGSDEYLPNNEYNIRFSTKPGGALFQEVVRYYGDDLTACGSEVDKIRETIEDSTIDHDTKRSKVMEMNKVCKFSVHSDSISRLNLYRDQSKCVRSNIEVKKVCYCNDLIK